MRKRDVFLLKEIAVSQIFLITLSIFSFAFLISEISNVNAQGATDVAAAKLSTPLPTMTSSATGVGSFANPITVSGYSQGSLTSVTFQPGAYTYEVKDGLTLIQQGDKAVYTSVDTASNAITESNKLAAQSGGQETSLIEGLFGNKPLTPNSAAGTWPVGNALASGVIYAAAAAAVVYFVGGLIGLDENQQEAAAIAAAAGVGIARAGYLLSESGYGFFTEVGFSSVPALWAVGIAVVVYLAVYKKESQKIYTFQCLPYEAPIGGRSCEECNKDPFRPCSEYRCRSLGQACELVNTGTTDEKCIWVNPNDAASPTITPWTEPLTENHRYTNHDTRPSSLGTKIVKNGATDGCLAAFTPLKFGILTNEPAQCKIDLDHKDSFDEMKYFFGGTNLYIYNHSMQFSLPSPSSLNSEVPELQADGKYDFFVRCRDKNGNENVDEFAIQLCVDPSPDTTAPVIVDTSIPSDSYVKFGAKSVNVQFYVNEPSTCRWSTQDKSYDIMENTMSCATSLTQVNARELYTCSTNLTGIVDRQNNNYFVRCKDQPSKSEEDRNVNVVSYEYNLKGSQPLNIISAGPNSTVTGSSNTVPVDLKVITDDGAEEGIAICSFSPTGSPDSYVLMFETRDVEHHQRLDLTSGNYNYHIKCVDFGGNSAEAEISFTVLVDSSPPLITRAYRDSSNNALKIVTNEDAECTYSLNSCNFNFDEGIDLLYISTSNKKSHFAEWKPNLAYYIKCRDFFDNEPAPNSCSLVASPTNIQ